MLVIDWSTFLNNISSGYLDLFSLKMEGQNHLSHRDRQYLNNKKKMSKYSRRSLILKNRALLLQVLRMYLNMVESLFAYLRSDEFRRDQ